MSSVFDGNNVAEVSDVGGLNAAIIELDTIAAAGDYEIRLLGDIAVSSELEAVNLRSGAGLGGGLFIGNNTPQNGGSGGSAAAPGAVKFVSAPLAARALSATPRSCATSNRQRQNVDTAYVGADGTWS